MPQTDLVIKQGRTFRRVLRWETEPVVFKAITGISKAAPAVVTAPSHGLVDGWRVAVVSAGGMIEINAEHDPPRKSDHHKVTVVSSSAVSLNGLDSSSFTTYTSGGYLRYMTPKSLAATTARMTIKDRVGGTAIISLTTENGRIAVDDTAKTITLLIAASDTEDLDFRKGVYDLEMISGTEVTELLYGTVTLDTEVTT